MRIIISALASGDIKRSRDHPSLSSSHGTPPQIHRESSSSSNKVKSLDKQSTSSTV